ncbi:4-hydroxy-3-methylbut-2-en-1-yl diphosphate synthase [Prevotella intermedia]|uniref:4-hydroxy-3-methylbut-2-en-1-yl diphosphate synthase (flavodoxin) n=1 Tax=Prevotella intermedia TaxID=28131 RepID=A0A2D3LIC7_PREIN|nr:4-hydroxy-3-methylbut-2-en-1-yl diphosphate synthase [Prevotella intermedia]ATV30296.1 4-hydroxy-3-methylbut-2-en-1-yl diphosphate synthase [Prevotella intermedia]PJI21903.1 4-hydroxy-3-methylbut-2-en-1-yl diphosphate synthase [Prevotella intermedia]
MIDLFNYERRKSSVTHVGALDIGGENPVRIQSMTTTNTNDTEASVAQAKRIIAAGGELVRLTTQGKREAENLKNINAQLRAEGITTPLCADVHFNANVADVAALYAEKVRINPGNYVDPGRTFKILEYTDEEYAKELKRIEDRLTPFIQICKENHTAVRIGVNHGSLSDRIMSRYGDTPEGIVESCMEFLRIFKKHDFNDIVISIKASNTVVMVRSVRLLMAEMEKEDMNYPLHLGVTEAGEGEDGRIKSAVGIGALLNDGIGDTIRVSLSEEPECEIPVAKYLARYIRQKKGHIIVPAETSKDFDYLRPERRKTKAVENIGGENVPVVIATRNAKEQNADVASTLPTPDYIYVNDTLPAELKSGQKYIIDYNAYIELAAKGELPSENVFPIFPTPAIPFIGTVKSKIKFLVLKYGTPSEEFLACLKYHPEVVVVCVSSHQNKLAEQRALVHQMMIAGVENPVVFAQMYQFSADESNENTNEPSAKEQFQLSAAADMGALMIDGLTDGLWLMNNGNISQDDVEQTAFGILQAGRLRMVKTEYISCPGCGRTLYDLRTTIARIKEATKGMTGLKIGIMGCIVNGPGEMADADYGYVGAGLKKVSLYRKKVCVEKNIPEEDAVEHLLALIKNDQK